MSHLYFTSYLTYSDGLKMGNKLETDWEFQLRRDSMLGSNTVPSSWAGHELGGSFALSNRRVKIEGRKSSKLPWLSRQLKTRKTHEETWCEENLIKYQGKDQIDLPRSNWEGKRWPETWWKPSLSPAFLSKQYWGKLIIKSASAEPWRSPKTHRINKSDTEPILAPSHALAPPCIYSHSCNSTTH